LHFASRCAAHARSGCNMLTRLPSVSRNETYLPTPGICIGSPRTLPPSFPTRRIADSMSSTPMTIDGYCAGQSGFFGKNPPLMAPAGAPGALFGLDLAARDCTL
jgi:hypothetical protein